MSRYWVVVSGPEIFRKTREMGFTRHGFKSTRRGMAAKIRPGDRLAFYVTGAKKFAATATVTSEVVEEYDRIWESDKKPAEMYPYRVQIKPDVVLADGHGVEAEPLHDRFSWTQKWPRANWTLAYQGNLHEVSEQDFALLEEEMRQTATAPRPAG
jgi:predicted RNA-binding protein